MNINMQERGDFQGAFACSHANSVRQAGCWLPRHSETSSQPPPGARQAGERDPSGVRRWIWNPSHALFRAKVETCCFPYATNKLGQESRLGRRKEKLTGGPPCGGSSSEDSQGGAAWQLRCLHRQRHACSKA